MNGYFGQQSHFLPSRIKVENYVGGMVVGNTDSQYTYETTDGLLTAYYEDKEINLITLNVSDLSHYKAIIEWN